MDQVGPAVRELTLSRCTAPARVGRDGLVRLAFEHRCGRTVLVERFFRTPLQVLEGIDFDGDPALGVVVLNPTGGVLGGDRLTVSARLGARAHVVMTTPSATRVYRANGAPAQLSTHVTIADDATLEYLPDHVIPHPGAAVVQETRFELSRGARLLLWDAYALGRPARGERWSFRRLAGSLRVDRGGRALFLDRFDLTAGMRALDGAGGTEGHSYVASWLAVSGDAHDWSAFADHLTDLFRGVAGLEAAGSALGAGGCVIRILARSAPALAEAQRRLWTTSRATLLGLAPLDLRKP